jgi:glucans biosynthesis protein
MLSFAICPGRDPRRMFLISVLVAGACAGSPTTRRAQPALAAATAEHLGSAPVPTSEQPMAEPPAHFAAVIERARALAAERPRPPRRAGLSGALGKLTYDQYRSIRFRPERSLWRGEPGRFEVQLFHPGFYYDELVDIRIIDGTQARPVVFSPELFSYDNAPPPPPGAQLGFTGLRLHAPINRAEYRDEVIVFHGASYFRSLGRDQVYGLSARALALQTGEPGPEEFPRFTEFDLVRPGPDDEHAWVLALLESERATGAYALRVLPGDYTTIEVTMRVFLRARVPIVGVAPLTSMYLFGEEAPGRFRDFRPEVHDSDGLAMWTRQGEWLFRPLRNPERTTVCSFRLDSPRGFGLLQRDRDFASYQDLEARYQDRPSAWVEPVGEWGPGAVRLLEMATERETDDNVAMLWVPDAVPAEGLALRYRLHLGPGVPSAGPLGHVTAMRIARVVSYATRPGEMPAQDPRRARFVVDFAGKGLDALDRAAQVDVDLTASGAKVVEQHTERNPFAGGVRASFELEAQSKDVELRAFLRSGDDVLTETWSYLWQPAQ